MIGRSRVEGGVESSLSAPSRPPPERPDPAALGSAAAQRPSDAALVRRARRGSRDAAATLFQRHWPSAHRTALAVCGRRAMADDIAQDAFERAFANLGRFDASRPFAPWLHRIVVNRALDLVRAERRLVSLDTADEPRREWDPTIGEGSSVLAALGALSPERRAVMVLRHLLDYRPPEIAAILGVPVGTVNSRLGRAVAQLRETMEREDG